MKKIIILSLLGLSLFGSTNSSIKNNQNYFFDFSNSSCVNQGKNFNDFKEKVKNKTIIEKDVYKEFKLSLYKYAKETEETKNEIFVSSETKEGCEEYKKMYIRMITNASKN